MKIKKKLQIIALRNQVLELETTLKELCEVKIIKDVQGKTPEYYQRKAAVWEKAYAFFPEYEAPKKPCCPDMPLRKGKTCEGCGTVS